MDKMLYAAFLFDFYGGLLTEKQRRAFEMHIENDFSLAEIADELKISRQGALDLLKRSGETMNRYEGILRLIEKNRERNILCDEIKKIIGAIMNEADGENRLINDLRAVTEKLDYMSEV